MPNRHLAKTASYATSGEAFRATRSPGAQSETFFIAAAVDRVWRAFTDPNKRKIWWGFPTDELKDALEVRPLNYFRKMVDHPGLPGPTEVSVTFEAVDGGTWITHATTGLGEGPEWDNARQASAHGLVEMMGDLALYLRTGVGFPRHVVFSCFDFLQGTREVPGGLEVYFAPQGSLAAELGLQPGDTIVAIEGAGVYGFEQVHFVTRSHKPGDVVEVQWVRGNQLLSGRGQMTATVSFRGGHDPRTSQP